MARRNRKPIRKFIPPKPAETPARPVQRLASKHSDGSDARNELVRAPIDVPRLRRELADHQRTDGAMWYRIAIEAGRQPIRPKGPADQVADYLAESEYQRLKLADLWYVDADLCDLLDAAYSSLPDFPAIEADLPSRHGFVMFAQPMAINYGDSTSAESVANDAVRMLSPDSDEIPELENMAAVLDSRTRRIVAATWGPVPAAALTDRAGTAGGVWMTFYAESALDPTNKIEAGARRMLPPLTVDNEAVIVWKPEAAEPDPFMLPARDNETTTVGWARILLAVFRLAAQRNLAETDTERTPRPERRLTERAELPERDVRVIRLRRSVREQRDAEASAAGERKTREYRHRWITRGHWRNVWYGPMAGPRYQRPTWIAPYIAGPPDAPLMGGEKVTVL